MKTLTIQIMFNTLRVTQKLLFTILTAGIFVSLFSPASFGSSNPFPLIGGIFVNLNSPAPTFNQTGADWAHAYSDLNAALAKAGDDTVPNNIWVAKGIYVPGTVPMDTFNISSDVSIYGGFKGTEKFLSQRNPSLHKTVLDGNLEGDVGDTIKTDNAWHVVTLPNTVTVVLDGLTIQNGYGIGGVSAEDAVNSQGAGIYSAAGSNLTLNNAVVQNNSITFPDKIFNNIDGGAIWFGYGGTLNINNSLFQNNSAASSGGAIITFFADVTIKNSTFTKNKTTFPFGVNPIPIDPIGGAALFVSGSIHIDHSQFIQNSASGLGGAIAWGALSFTNHEFIVENSKFKNNHSGYIYGALGLANFDVTDNSQMATIKNTTFENNSATDSTGALGIDSLNASVERSTFINNSSKFGGAVTLTNVSASLFGLSPGIQTIKNNCLFITNKATGGTLSQAYLDYNAGAGITQPADQPIFGGGAIVITENANATIESSKFIGNIAPNGGAISVAGYSIEFGTSPIAFGATALIKNNLFKRNQATAGDGGVILSKSWHFSGFEPGGPTMTTAENNNLSLNQAKANGGALSLIGGDMNIYNNRFLLNIANEKGNHIYGKDSTINRAATPAVILDSLKLNNVFLPPPLMNKIIIE